jgi:hypothetical protein
MPLSQGNIGHCDVALFNAISHLNRFEAGTENPRVGGSIPPLATIKIRRSVANAITLHRVLGRELGGSSNLTLGGLMVELTPPVRPRYRKATWRGRRPY